MTGNAIHMDPQLGPVLLNQTDIPDSQVMGELARQHPEVAALARWSYSIKPTTNLFERDRYVTPVTIFDQMRTSMDAAANDDVVAGILEASEALALSGRMTIESFDEDEQDIWSQIADDIDLDNRLREMWRELFIVSQCYVATWWGRKTYRVRGRSSTTGTKRKKVLTDIKVPIGMSLLDPLRVVPIGNMMFNQDALAYIPISKVESQNILDVLNGSNRSSDEIINQLIVAPYEPTREELRLLSLSNVSPSLLFVLNPKNVWRHTLTRPQYRRWADVRLKSVFELLDLKHQLREMDRAMMLGSTNFIVLVKKGSDKEPATQTELDNLQQNVRSLARVPVLVGDHRLTVEIITPKTDHTLQPDRYIMLDNKIAGRLYQTFMTNMNAIRDDTLKLARVVGKGLEARRQSLKSVVEKQILLPTYNANESITEIPKIMFHPQQIALDFDAGFAQFMFDLRNMGEISRETILSFVDLDQVDEARKRSREEKLFDGVFQTAVPFNSPANNPVGGGAGGALPKLPGAGGSNPHANEPNRNDTGADIKPPTATGPSETPPNQNNGPASKTPGGSTAQPGRVNPGSPAGKRSAGRAGGGQRSGAQGKRGGAAPGSGQGKHG